MTVVFLQLGDSFAFHEQILGLADNDTRLDTQVGQRSGGAYRVVGWPSDRAPLSKNGKFHIHRPRNRPRHLRSTQPTPSALCLTRLHPLASTSHVVPPRHVISHVAVSSPTTFTPSMPRKLFSRFVPPLTLSSPVTPHIHRSRTLRGHRARGK